MMTEREKLLPEQAVRLLRTKADQLESAVLAGSYEPGDDYDLQWLVADIALIAGLLADHIERSGPDDRAADGRTRRERIIVTLATAYWRDPEQYQRFPEAMILDLADAIEASGLLADDG